MAAGAGNRGNGRGSRRRQPQPGDEDVVLLGEDIDLDEELEAGIQETEDFESRPQTKNETRVSFVFNNPNWNCREWNVGYWSKMTQPNQILKYGTADDKQKLPPPGPRNGTRRRNNNNNNNNNNNQIGDQRPTQRQRLNRDDTNVVEPAGAPQDGDLPDLAMPAGREEMHNERNQPVLQQDNRNFRAAINNARGDQDGNIMNVGPAVARNAGLGNATDPGFHERLAQQFLLDGGSTQ